MRTMLTALDDASRAHRNKLLAVKDLEDTVAPEIGAALQAFGFAKIRSLPNAYLDLPFASWEQFLQSHSRSSKRYFTRKERTLDRMRLEYREDIGSLSPICTPCTSRRVASRRATTARSKRCIPTSSTP